MTLTCLVGLLGAVSLACVVTLCALVVWVLQLEKTQNALELKVARLEMVEENIVAKIGPVVREED